MSDSLGPLREDGGPANEIYRRFRGLIVSGRLGSGERLPTVRQVARDLGVAPGTAAKAFKLLEREGLVVSRTGAGTRVAESATTLPGRIVAQVRTLVAEARREGLAEEDLISAVRNAYQET